MNLWESFEDYRLVDSFLLTYCISMFALRRARKNLARLADCPWLYAEQGILPNEQSYTIIAVQTEFVRNIQVAGHRMRPP